VVKRSYADEVIAKLEPLKKDYDVEQYGALSQDPSRYPLFCVKTRGWDPAKPTIMITGGVHGYETSGVHGALLFLTTEAMRFSALFNIIVCPCVSPWSYECIQRWSINTVDPNRAFLADAPCEEAAAVVALVERLAVPQWTMHMDLHETTDTDDSEFRPAKAARDGEAVDEDEIPDGFYLIGDEANPQAEWHTAVIEAVRKITHIAPADKNNKILGVLIGQEGVINSNKNGKGKGVTNAAYTTTTEVYPDSKTQSVSSEQCNQAQVAAITAGLEYIAAKL